MGNCLFLPQLNSYSSCGAFISAMQCEQFLQHFTNLATWLSPFTTSSLSRRYSTQLGKWSVLGRASAAVAKHDDQKATAGGEGLFELHFNIALHHLRKSGQKFKQSKNLEARSGAESRRGASYWLVSYGLLSTPSYRTQRPSTTGLTLLYWSLNEKVSYSRISLRHVLWWL